MFENNNNPFDPKNTTDPYYEPQRNKKGSGLGLKIGKAFLCVLLVAAISVGSISGYVWYTENYGDTADAQQPVQGQPQQNITQTYYELANGGEGLTAPQIYQKGVNWVVALTCQVPATTSGSSMLPGFGGSLPGYGDGSGSAMGVATGTGIIMSADGYILTNAHVVEGATQITVTLTEGTEYPATVIGSDENTDIAVVKINATGLPAAEFGDSTQLVTGEDAIVIGNPLGQTFADTMTQGIISSTERQVSIGGHRMTLIQIDAAVNPGNSGGPLFNSRGQVVGVVNAKISTEDVEGIGFAIPSDIALTVAEDLIRYGYVASRPMLGISVQSVTEEQAQMYGLEPGVTVKSIDPGSAAAKAGMQLGDKIVAYNGTAVSTAEDLNFLKEKDKVGDTATVTVERNGQKVDLQITYEHTGATT